MSKFNIEKSKMGEWWLLYKKACHSTQSTDQTPSTRTEG